MPRPVFPKNRFCTCASGERVRRFALSLALMCCLLLTLITITAPLVPNDWARLNNEGVYLPVRFEHVWPSYAVQVGLWVGMLTGLWVAAGGFGFGEAAASQVLHRQKPLLKFDPDRKNDTPVRLYVGLAIIIAIGFGLRMNGIDRLPLIIDEIGFAAHASDILHGQAVPIFAPGHNAMPVTTSWLMAGAMALLGQNTLAARLIAVMFGTLTIAAVYRLGCEWWSGRVGLAAAAVLATYPAHVHFSRMALNNLIDPFFAALALVALTRAIRHDSKRGYVAAGVLTGAAQYFYQGSRLLLVVMGVYWLSAISGQWSARKDATQGHEGAKTQRFVYLFAVAFGMAALPRFAPMITAGLPISGNLERLHLPADWPANSARAALAWVGQPDISPFWLSEHPLLEWAALLGLALGVVACARSWRDGWSAALLLTLALTTLFGGVIWAAAPLYVRYMTAAPAIALVTAVGAEKIKAQRREPEKLKSSVDSYRLPVARILQAAAVIVICAQGAVAALQHPVEAEKHITASQWWEDDLARQASQLPPDTAAVLIVPPEFSDIQRITAAHYTAAYGQRRAVVVNRDGGHRLSRQLEQLPGKYAAIRPRLRGGNVPS